MTENEILNSFITRDALNDTELRLQNKCKTLQESFNTANQNLQTARQNLTTKEAEFMQSKHYLEMCYSIAFEIEKSKLETNKTE